LAFPEEVNPLYYLPSNDGAKVPYFNRELSWLSFNHRVLQEAMDETVPLFEQIKFLAIYSSNLDEFFKIRVSAIRHMMHLGSKASKKIPFDPHLLHRDIMMTVAFQQELFLDTFYKKVIPGLQRENIYLINEKNLQRAHHEFLSEYFDQYIRPWSRPMIIIKNKISVFLKNNTLYLFLRMVPREEKTEQGAKKRRRSVYASLEIPTDHLSRWVTLPALDGRHYVMFLDDVIRFNMKKLFPGYEILESRAIKLTRDADIPIEDEFSGDVVKAVKKLIQKRSTGVITRIMHDKKMSPRLKRYMMDALSLQEEDLIPGDRYLSYEHLFDFPRFGRIPEYKPLPPLHLKLLKQKKGIFERLSGQRILLYFPYHAYDPVLNFLYQAARDPAVLSIKITLYRIAAESKLIKALRKAAENGKDVTVFIELKARFDELRNLQAAEKLESSGVNVLYSLPVLKVHSKVCLVSRQEGEKLHAYAYLATGNFNESTSRSYCDFGFFTDDEKLVSDIREVFRVLAGVESKALFKELIVAPVNMRRALNQLIDFEIEEARKGAGAEIIFKVNGLEDEKIIRKLYEASGAGVDVKLIVRSICCLVPGVKGASTRIRAISIVDRYLEHARVFSFYHGGKKRTFLSSADLMTRNLNRRIESAFEIKEPELKQTVLDILALQWADNVKARILDSRQLNSYVPAKGPALEAQLAIYDYLAAQ